MDNCFFQDDVKVVGLGDQEIEHIDLVHPAIADVDEGWDIVAQTEQRMHLDDSLSGTEARPRKDAKAQADGRGIECIDHLFQLHREAAADVKLSGSLDQFIAKSM